METLYQYVRQFFNTYMRMPDIMVTDIIEIIILAFIVYEILLWFKNTRAWSLLKGILFLIFCVAVASFFNFSTILWIANNFFNVAIIAIVVIFQPELRRALEQIGQNRVIPFIIGKNSSKHENNGFTEEVVNQLIRAAFELGRAKTGALIVIERSITLDDYIKTGIDIDGIVTAELLINIFEHNTPLHDGAVIMRGNRIVSATCYLPVSENMELSKELGTRHRAGLGISEVSDALTIIVSEETGKISITQKGVLTHNIDGKLLRDKLMEMLDVEKEDDGWFAAWKGRLKHEENADK